MNRASWAGRFGIATVLVGMTLLAALPVLGYALWATNRLSVEREQEQLGALHRRSVAVAAAAAREVDQARDVMAALRSAYAARRGHGTAVGDEDLRDLHRFATELAGNDPHVNRISLALGDGRLLFQSGRPWGAALPAEAGAGIDAEVIQRARTMVAPLVHDAHAGLPEIAVAGPLELAGGARMSLRIALRQAALSDAVRSLQFPDPWLATVIDQNGRIVARSRDEARYLGEPVADDTLQAMRERRLGVFAATARHGVPVWAAMEAVPGTPWSAIVSVPREELRELAIKPVRSLAMVGMGLTALGSLLALALGKWVTGELRHAVVGQGDKALAVDELHRIRLRLQEGAAAVVDALHDPLTKLPGRALLTKRAEALVHRQAGCDEAASVLFVDLDGFKHINDAHGHHAGDDALAAVAGALRASVRAGDIAGRWGGDEFVVVLQGASALLPSLAEDVARRIQQGIRAWGRGLDATIGVAPWSARESLDAVITRADAAMLAGKRDGKGRIVCIS